MSALKTIKKDSYRGYKINNTHDGVFEQYMDKLIDLSLHAQSEQYEPIGYVLSFALCEGKTIKQFQEALKYFYAKSSRREKTPCEPLYATKYEIKDLTTQSPEYEVVDDPSKPYAHYHMALILDGKKVREKSLTYFLSMQKQKGILSNYHLSKNHYDNSKSKKLNESFEEWIYHISYLAKLDTTADVKKPFNSVRF